MHAETHSHGIYISGRICQKLIMRLPRGHLRLRTHNEKPCFRIWAPWTLSYCQPPSLLYILWLRPYFRQPFQMMSCYESTLNNDTTFWILYIISLSDCKGGICNFYIKFFNCSCYFNLPPTRPQYEYVNNWRGESQFFHCFFGFQSSID